MEQSGRLLAGAPAYIGQADSHRVRLVEIGLQVLLMLVRRRNIPNSYLSFYYLKKNRSMHDDIHLV